MQIFRAIKIQFFLLLTNKGKKNLKLVLHCPPNLKLSYISCHFNKVGNAFKGINNLYIYIEINNFFLKNNSADKCK